MMETPEKTHLTPEDPKKPVHIAVKLKRGQHAEILDGLPLKALIQSLNKKQFDELANRARKLNPDLKPKEQLPDFSLWYQVVTPSGADPDEIVARLRKLSSVETAYAMRPVPPPTNPPGNPRSSHQGYLDAAKKGIGARGAWPLPGGDGGGIGFVDMERGWNLNHEDLPAGITMISGDNFDEFAHGTSVLGLVLMVDNQVGGLGIARGASGRVVSQWRKSDNHNSNDPGSFNNADAIHSAIYSMAFGDVLLLEAQEFDPERSRAYWPVNLWPVEIAPATFEALGWAQALGIVVVEAAANGGNNLDQYTTGKGEPIFDPTFRDSGAIMVAAASSAYPHTPVATNTGKRIDCYAWGENIDTTTTNANGTDNSAYRPDPTHRTLGFDGTSGAAAIVAGAALVVQGLARARLGAPFKPEDLRQVLKTNGTASAGGAGDGIGVMPNLQNIIADNRLAPPLG